MLLSLWLLNCVDLHSSQIREYGLLNMFVLFVQQAYMYGTVGLFMICFVFLSVYWYVCKFICLSVCGYGTTDIKLFLLLLRLYCRSKKTLRQDKGSESNVCIRVGPDGAASHDRFRNSPTGPLITFRDGPRGLGEVGGRPSFVALL